MRHENNLNGIRAVPYLGTSSGGSGLTAPALVNHSLFCKLQRPRLALYDRLKAPQDILRPRIVPKVGSLALLASQKPLDIGPILAPYLGVVVSVTATTSTRGVHLVHRRPALPACREIESRAFGVCLLKERICDVNKIYVSSIISWSGN